MIIAIMLLTISAYLGYRFVRYARIIATLDDRVPPRVIKLLSPLCILFQILTCVGFSWIVLSFIDLVRNNL